MFLNINALKKHRDFRVLYSAQFISMMGSMMTYVAMPYQVYQLTKSSSMVGNVSLVQLAVVVVFALLGGAYADRLDRKKIMVFSNLLMCIASLGLAFNASTFHPSLLAIFICTALTQCGSGFYRPASQGTIQKLLPKDELSQVGGLLAFAWSSSAIIGPAIAGIIMSRFGVRIIYFIDFISFFTSVVLISRISIPKTPKLHQDVKSKIHKDILEGFRFLFSMPRIFGSYLIDIVAMIFAYPVSLYPEMSQQWGGAHAAGLLYSGMAIGAFVVSLLSGWTTHTKKMGLGLLISAGFWGFFILFLGVFSSLYHTMGALILAGAADAISGIFRMNIWNAEIPNEMRGRLGGIEMISYMSGPLLGNARAGYVASLFSLHTSLLSGGVLCLIGVVITGFLLPQLRKEPA